MNKGKTFALNCRNCGVRCRCMAPMVEKTCDGKLRARQTLRVILITQRKRHIISPLSVRLIKAFSFMLEPFFQIMSDTKERKILRTATAIEKVIFYTTLSLAVLVPLTFSSWVYRVFTLPRFIVLLAGAAILLVALSLRYGIRQKTFFAGLRSTRPQRWHIVIAFSFLATIFLSTIFGASPTVSFFGSFENQMGFLTHLCFLIVFVGVLAGVGNQQKRLQNYFLAISITGLLVSVYAIVQFFGSDPFLPISLYMFDSPEGKIIRVISSLGHSNYLGNFLLYTTLVTASLAVTTQGSVRRVFLIGTLLSLIAVIISGTRGAWLGLGIGLAFFFIYELQPTIRAILVNRRKRLAYLTFGSLLFLTSLWVIGSNQYSNPIIARTRSTILEGFTGSGRTILWRDSLHLIPRYWLTGCGPEAFRKAFLPYKSKELAQLAPQINNESPHNAYLDAMISFGLIGGFLYFLFFGSSLYLLFQARRILADRKHKILASGLAASLIAVAMHNFFIFDQIPTGLYFFVFAALSQATLNVAIHLAPSKENDVQPHKNTEGGLASLTSRYNRLRFNRLVTRVLPTVRWTMVIPSLGLFGLAIWYSVSLIGADLEVKKATDAARSGNPEKSFQQALSFNHKTDMDGAYGFAMARALALSADRIQTKLKSLPHTPGEAEELVSARDRIIDLATQHTSRSITHTLTPDSSYLLLAYLANVREDYPQSEHYARATLTWDRYAPNAHWLVAAARLAQGDQEEAIREAELALELNPFSAEARQVFKQARGTSGGRTPVELVERALKLIDRGNRAKAKRLLVRAKRLADGNCPDCQEALAKIEEAERRQP
jgi:O-antigen ligase